MTMKYVLQRRSEHDFSTTVEKVTEELAKEGFGVLTQIDVKATLKKKLDVDFRNYLILGACNPQYAYQALQTEPWIGSMLPCNVVVQEFEDGRVELAAVDPLVSMQAVENPALEEIATTIRAKLQQVVDAV
jgi:uncharacterized protein (DUF302 family)